MPFHDAPKKRKSKPVDGKPQTMPTIPATSECHFTKPNRKSTTAPIEKKASGVRRFISPRIMLHSGKMSEMAIYLQFDAGDVAARNMLDLLGDQSTGA